MGQQSCGIRKSIQAKWVHQSRIKTKIEKGTPFKRSITKSIEQTSKFTEANAESRKKYQLHA